MNLWNGNESGHFSLFLDAKEFLDVKEDVFGVKTEILWGKRAYLQGNLGKDFFW